MTPAGDEVSLDLAASTRCRMISMRDDAIDSRILSAGD
jgi:hypothetical protein